MKDSTKLQVDRHGPIDKHGPVTGACLSTQSFVLCLIHAMHSLPLIRQPIYGCGGSLACLWWLVGLLTCRAIVFTCRAILLPCRAILLTCRAILLTCLAMPCVVARWLIHMPTCLIHMLCHLIDMPCYHIDMLCHALPHWDMSHMPHMSHMSHDLCETISEKKRLHRRIGRVERETMTRFLTPL